MTEQERQILITLRLQSAKETLAEIPVHIEHCFWNTAVSRMYYACYYVVEALLLQHGISVKTHSGIRQAFSKEFVMTGIVDKGLSKFYSRLFDSRQSGDYNAFIMMNEDKVKELYPRAIFFIETIEQLIKSGATRPESNSL